MDSESKCLTAYETAIRLGGLSLEDEPRNSLPTDVLPLAGYQLGTLQQNGTIAALRPREKVLGSPSQVPAFEFNHFNSVPSASIISTQNVFFDGRHLLSPNTQSAELHSGAAYNIYYPAVEYSSIDDVHQCQMEMQEPRTAEGLQHYIKGTFQSERGSLVDSQFRSPINSPSIDYEGLFIDNTFPFEDFLLNEAEVMEYCGGA